MGPLMKPPNPPESRDARAVGGWSLVTGALTLVSVFFTVQIFESSPIWIFVVGLVLGTVSLGLAVLAVRAPRGSRGRGTGATGIVLAILGILLSAFGVAGVSGLNATPS